MVLPANFALALLTAARFTAGSRVMLIRSSTTRGTTNMDEAAMKSRAPTTARWARTGVMIAPADCTVTLDAKGAITVISDWLDLHARYGCHLRRAGPRLPQLRLLAAEDDG